MTNLRLLTLSIAFAVLGLVLLSCGDGDGSDVASSDPGTDSASLEATYVVTGVTEGGAPRALVKGSEIRLRFEKGRLGVTAGCNTMGGTYTLDGTRLTVSDLSMTEMGCDSPLMEQDTWVAGLFTRAVQLTTGPDASLISGDVVLALTDREVVSPDKPLVGTRWVLDTLVDGDAASSLPQGSSGYLTLTTKTRYDTSVPCGTSQGGRYSVEGDRITFTSSSAGIADCFGTNPDVEGDNGLVSEAFRSVLGADVRWSIEENRLTITRGDRGLGFTAAPD